MSRPDQPLVQPVVDPRIVEFLQAVWPNRLPTPGELGAISDRELGRRIGQQEVIDLLATLVKHQSEE